MTPTDPPRQPSRVDDGLDEPDLNLFCATPVGLGVLLGVVVAFESVTRGAVHLGTVVVKLPLMLMRALRDLSA